jgi:hypothetical protein
MLVKTQPAEILIVGDTPAFGRTISAIVRGSARQLNRFRHTTYASLRGILSPRLLRETDLFILELWRSYSTGLRAEGLAVREELSKHRVRSLVISPLSLASEVDQAWYWDIGAQETLPHRCERLLINRVGITPTSDHCLEKWLAPYLAKPVGHTASPEE